jgi:prolyl oligopeptidase
MFAPNSRYMIARTTDTTVPEGRLYVAQVAELGRKTIAWRQIASAADKITDAQLRGNILYLRTYAGAPRGRVLALALDDPVLTKAMEVVAEPAVGVLQGFALGRDAIYAEVQQGFTTRARRFGAGVAAGGTDVAPGLAGSTFMVGDPAHAHADALIATSTWTEPSRVFVVDAQGTTRDTGLRNNTRPSGAPEIEVSEVLVNSHDGAKVPLAILRRKGLALDGNNPALLVGYGAYGFSFEAYFDVRSLAWLERGGVLAYANVRGSGAFGDAWYRAGFKSTKANTWKDGLACAQYLIDQRYASTRTLGISGTSAGGIFVGRAVTSAPDLFAAAIFNVGVLDAVRSEESANGITNISEFGTVKDPQEFAALLEMSTYHQIKDGTAYPAVMLVHGMNDPRVDVWNSAKTAARLLAASSGGRPILLRLDGQAGHGIGSTAQQAFSQQADIYSFLLWQFDKMALKP